MRWTTVRSGQWTGILLRKAADGGLAFAWNGKIDWRHRRQGRSLPLPQAHACTHQDHAPEQTAQRVASIHLTH
ncbi:hypothetical protein BCCGELA001_23505 [Bradyrhizobium sp. CCGE-LA001]|nr:hypothetical protein BCCGELA001_23505 [Bradyrhizobium sp. CCGE-LA001]